MSKYSPEKSNSNIENSVNINFIKEAIKSKLIIESLVIRCDSNNDLTLSIGNGIIGNIPFNEVEYSIDGSTVESVSAISKVGKFVKYIPLKIIETDDGYEVMCSRKLAQEDCYNNYISKLKVGDVIPAKAVHVEDFGIFCDIGCGIVALLPTSNISITYITEAKKVLTGINRLTVVIEKILPDNKIQLSHKELLGTWDEQVKDINIGDIVVCTVLNVMEYGVFLRISQNLSGLAEVTNLKLSPGDRVIATIYNIIPEKMKIKLSIIKKTNKTERFRFRYSMVHGHISSWTYSPKSSKKVIETTFD